MTQRLPREAGINWLVPLQASLRSAAAASNGHPTPRASRGALGGSPATVAPTAGGSRRSNPRRC